MVRMSLVLVTLISLASFQHASGALCKDVIDIAFIIDSSASMGQEWLVSAMAFAIQFTDNFTVGYDHTRFAMITFSKEAKAEFRFNDYTTLGEVKLAVEKVEFQSKSSRIDKAIHVAMTEVFVAKTGSRTSASRFIVVASDGLFPVEGLPNFDSMIKPVTDGNIEIFAVGIGDEAMMSDLNALTLNKTQNVYPSPSDLHRDSMVNRMKEITVAKCAKVR